MAKKGHDPRYCDKVWTREDYLARVAKNPQRIEYAIAQFQAHNIKFEVKDKYICHIHAWRKRDGQLMQFWAGTGTILNSKKRGIDNFIKLLES